VEKLATDAQKDLAATITRQLAGTIDSAQAEIFGRRAAAVDEMLTGLVQNSPEARVLKTAFAGRLWETRQIEPQPLRVRAIIDFFYSRAGILHYRTKAGSTALPDLMTMVDSSRWNKIGRGLFRWTVAGLSDHGPLHANALRFDRGRFRFSSLDLRGNATDLPDLIAAQKAVAGFSGGFFLYSETPITPPAQRHDPVGLLVCDGLVIAPPIYRRPVFYQRYNGHTGVVTVGLKGLTINGVGRRFKIHSVNSIQRNPQGPVAFNRAFPESLSGLSGPRLTIVGRTVIPSVDTTDECIPVGGWIVQFPDRPEWAAFVQDFLPGTELSFQLAEASDETRIREAIAGGPTLLMDSKILPHAPEDEDLCHHAEPATFAQDETLDQNLLPRLAVGTTKDHKIIVLAVDGRNIDQSLGLTIRHTARVMRALGCTDAINLDGGSSKRLALPRRTLDLPSTEIQNGQESNSVRPLYSAFLVHEIESR
jgi:hypothetical protein